VLFRSGAALANLKNSWRPDYFNYLDPLSQQLDDIGRMPASVRDTARQSLLSRIAGGAAVSNEELRRQVGLLGLGSLDRSIASYSTSRELMALKTDRPDEYRRLVQEHTDLLVSQAAAELNNNADYKGELKQKIDELSTLYQSGKLTQEGLRLGILAAREEYRSRAFSAGNPDLMLWGGGSADRSALIASGRLYDPSVAEAKKTNEILEEIRDGQTPTQIYDF